VRGKTLPDVLTATRRISYRTAPPRDERGDDERFAAEEDAWRRVGERAKLMVLIGWSCDSPGVTFPLELLSVAVAAQGRYMDAAGIHVADTTNPSELRQACGRQRVRVRDLDR
jgi:hypothetical protein